MTIDDSHRPFTALIVSEKVFSDGTISKVIANVTDIKIGVKAYCQAFTETARRFQISGDRDAVDTIQILFSLCHMCLQPSNTKAPFASSMSSSGYGTPTLSDFSADQIHAVLNYSKHISDPLLLSRIFDASWVHLKHFDSVKRVIPLYLALSKDPRFQELVRYYYFERAVRLSRQIKNEEMYSLCKVTFQDIQAQHSLYQGCAIYFLSLAQDIGLLEPLELAKEASAFADLCHKLHPFNLRDFLLIAAQAYTRLGNEEAAKDCHRRAANHFRMLTDEADALTAIRFIEEEIEALRRAGAKQAEIREANRRLIEKGKESTREMKLVQSKPVNFSELARIARKSVQGRTSFDGLRYLASQFPVPEFSGLRKEVEEEIQQNPLSFLFQRRFITTEGRQYNRRYSLFSEDKKNQEAAIEAEIAMKATPDLMLTTQFGLLEALTQLHFSTQDFVEIYNFLYYCSIVPPQHADAVFIGIRHGIEGDFFSAAHVLIPQLEISLRFLLEARGHVVTTLNSENLHKEMSLNVLFENYRAEIAGLLFSEDLALFIEFFFCQKNGENLRNELAHGLVSKVNDLRLVLAWWIFLHLIFRPEFNNSEDTRVEGTKPSGLKANIESSTSP